MVTQIVKPQRHDQENMLKKPFDVEFFVMWSKHKHKK